MTEAKTLLDRYLLAWIEPHPARRTWCSTTTRPGMWCGMGAWLARFHDHQRPGTSGNHRGKAA